MVKCTSSLSSKIEVQLYATYDKNGSKSKMLSLTCPWLYIDINVVQLCSIALLKLIKKIFNVNFQ